MICNKEKVLSIHHYTDELFSFKTTRDKSFRFKAGEFTMIGLEVNGKPLLRAYSMASSPYDDELEFYSIKVQDGPLTSKLQSIKVGDEILVGTKPVGTLVLDSLLPGKRLLLLSTGTGFAPFASVIRDYQTYERFETVVATHTCRNVKDLQYSVETVAHAEQTVGALFEPGIFNLIHYKTTTREESRCMGRITDLIYKGRMFTDIQQKILDPNSDRIMICGSLAMNLELKGMLDELGFVEGRMDKPGGYVIERAFVD